MLGLSSPPPCFYSLLYPAILLQYSKHASGPLGEWWVRELKGGDTKFSCPFPFLSTSLYPFSKDPISGVCCQMWLQTDSNHLSWLGCLSYSLKKSQQRNMYRWCIQIQSGVLQGFFFPVMHRHFANSKWYLDDSNTKKSRQFHFKVSHAI